MLDKRNENENKNKYNKGGRVSSDQTIAIMFAVIVLQTLIFK